MADDGIADGNEPDAPEKPKRPLTAFEIRLRTYEKEQAEKKERVERVKTDNGKDIEHVAKYRGADDPDVRARTVDFVANELVEKRREFKQMDSNDLHRIVDRSIGLAEEAQRRQWEQERKAAEEERRAKLEPDKYSRDVKNAENEHKDARGPEKVVTDANAIRLARAIERGEKAETWERAQQETTVRQPTGRGR